MCRSLRVLIPEDSEDDALLLLRELKMFGYRPEHLRVDSAEGFRDAIRERTWDVILCDYSMPGFSGLAALEILRESGRDIPFIIISGDIGEEVAVQALKAGAHDYLMKGRFSRLGEAIEREIGQAKVRAEHRRGIETIRHLNRVLRAVRGIHKLMVGERNPDALLRRAAEILVEMRGYSSAVFLLTDEAGGPRSIAASVESAGVRDATVAPEVPDRLPGCLARSVEQARSIVLECDTPDCAECGFRPAHVDRIRLARRLSHEDRVFGGAVISLPSGIAPGEEELELFNEVVEDLSFCLRSIEVATREREAEQKVQSIFEGSPVGIFTTTSRGRVLSANPAMARMLDFDSPEDALERFEDLGSQLYVDFDRRNEFLRRLETDGTVENFEYEARTVGGRRIWLSMSARVGEHREDGTFTIEGFTNEITELKRAERQFQAFMEHTPLIACLKGPDGAYLWANPRADELAGGRVAGRGHGFALIDGSEEVIDDFREQDRLVLEENEIVQVREMRVPLQTGERFVDIHKFPVPGPDGSRLLGVVCIDVTGRVRQRAEFEQLQQQFLQSQKLEAVGQLAGGVAHDFNNLLTVILGQCELAERMLTGDDPLKGKIAQIASAAGRASTLTRQLLAFSRKQTLQPAVLDLNELLRDLESLLFRLIGEDIRFRVLPGDDLGRVLADPGQIEQVVMNLVVNARDAMPDGGRLILETENVELSEDYARTHVDANPGRFVMLAVSDTGHGFDEETRARVFEPFFTTKAKEKGTGLGLSTAYGIVRQSGGHVSVYSEPGMGTTFKIYLPRTDAEPSELPIPLDGEPAQGNGEIILVVEDEVSIRDLMEVMLSNLGYRTVCAADGDEAVRIVEKEGIEPDLVVTDVVMSGMSGAQLAEKLREKRPDLRVLFMSGYTDNAIVHQGVLDPGVPFLPKPFSATELGAAVRSLLQM